jgi:hypothetical protein
VHLLYVVASAMMLAVGYVSGGLIIQYIVAGIYAYLIVRFFQSNLELQSSLYQGKPTAASQSQALIEKVG